MCVVVERARRWPLGRSSRVAGRSETRRPWQACEADVADLHFECRALWCRVPTARSSSASRICRVWSADSQAKGVPRACQERPSCVLRRTTCGLRRSTRYATGRRVHDDARSGTPRGLDGLVCDGLWTRRRDDRRDRSLQQVLIDPAVLVQQAQRRLEAVPSVWRCAWDDPRSRRRERGRRHRHGRLRQEGRVIHEAPNASRPLTLPASR